MPSLNYLQGMAGRFGRGANTLGSMVDPRQRFAQQLAAEGMDTSPAFVGEGLGRLGKALVGALLMKRSMKDQADASRWLTAKRPDRTRQPTEKEALEADPELQLLQQRMRRGPDVSQQPARDKFATRDYENILGDFRESVPDTDDVLMKDPRMTPIIDKLSRYGPHVEDEDEDVWGLGTPFKDAVDTQSADFNETLSRLREESTKFRPRDYAQELASGMEAYRSDPKHQISDPYTRMEWLRESARGLEGNPFVSRMLQNLMFADMQREIAKEDIESARGFQTSEREAGQKFRAGESEKAWERKKEEMKRTGWTLKPKSLPNGKEQMTWYKQSTREEIPQGDPYDPNILSKEALAQKRAGEGTGPFRGKSIQGQEMNILLSPNADTSAPLFHAAYAELGQPKIYTDPTTGQQRLITPDMRMYPKPTELNPNSTWNPLTMQTPVQEEPLQGKGYWEPMDYSQHGGIPGQERPVGTPTISAQEGPVGRTKEYNEFQAKSGGFYSRMLDANKTLDDLFAGPDRTTGTADDLTRKDVFSNREFILNAVPGIGNYLTSDNFQKGRQAMRNWVTANLRLESGAAIPPEELENEYIKWFPVFGDGAEVIKQKRESRKIVEENMRIQSQGAWESEFKPTWEERLKTREREGLGGGLSLDKPLGEGAFKMLPDGSIVRKERGAR